MSTPISILYRISDGGNQKEKLKDWNKIRCLKNAISVFGTDSFHVFADHCHPETLNSLHTLGLQPIETRLGNAGSWIFCAEWALKNTPPEANLYFLEDDYVHLPQAPVLLSEGLEMGDYVSLYDHPDKYRAGDNPWVESGGEISRVLLGPSCHWKNSNSTTMTFAVRYQTLKEDFPVWKNFMQKGYPEDFLAFQFLQSQGAWTHRIFGKRRLLLTSIPGFATHTETAFLSPLRNWQNPDFP